MLEPDPLPKSLFLQQAREGNEGKEQEKERKRKLLAGRRRLGKGKKATGKEKMEKETGTFMSKWTTLFKGKQPVTQ